MGQIQVDRLPFRSNLPETQKNESDCNHYLCYLSGTVFSVESS